MPVKPSLPTHKCQVEQREGNGELPEFHAGVEPEQPKRQHRTRQMEVDQHAGKAKPVDQSEAERGQPGRPHEGRTQIVERRRNDRPGDGRFDQPGRQMDEAPRRQRKRQRMRHREGGDHAQHVPPDGRERRDRLPLAIFARSAGRALRRAQAGHAAARPAGTPPTATRCRRPWCSSRWKAACCSSGAPLSRTRANRRSRAATSTSAKCGKRRRRARCAKKPA